MADTRPLLAVLIDADNVPARYAEAMFEEIAALGEASIRRIYGDFSDGAPQGWKKSKLADLAILPHQQFANTTGKNASDIALVIDAMDILHAGRFDGFVLVSSDSDFTRLASRIREQGTDVFGLGEKKTPAAFRNACKRFIYLENLGRETRESPPKAAKAENFKEARELVLRAMDATEAEDEWYILGQVGQNLVAQNPDFDTRTYGVRKLSELVGRIGIFETRKDGNNQLLIRRVD